MKVEIRGKGLSGKPGCIMVGLWLTIVVVYALVGGYCLEYDVEFWGSYIKQHPIDAPYFWCCIGAIPLGTVAIPVAIVTKILSMANLVEIEGEA